MACWSCIPRDLARLRALPGRRRRDALRAALLLTALPPWLRVVGFRAVLARLERAAGPRARGVDARRTGELCAAVDAVAERLPWRPRCLPRAMTLWLLLQRSGLAAELCLGVRRRGRGLEAHAWVEGAGRPLEPTDAWSALPACAPGAARGPA